MNSVHSITIVVGLLVSAVMPLHSGFWSPRSAQPPIHLAILMTSCTVYDSAKIAAHIESIAQKRENMTVEIIDISAYALPWYDHQAAPAERSDIVDDPALKRWAAVVARGDLFVIIMPEGCIGYPGILKNAIDSLYTEWNGKPVVCISSSDDSQLRVVLDSLSMVTMPGITRAQCGDVHRERTINSMLDTLLVAHSSVWRVSVHKVKAMAIRCVLRLLYSYKQWRVS